MNYNNTWSGDWGTRSMIQNRWITSLQIVVTMPMQIQIKPVHAVHVHAIKASPNIIMPRLMLRITMAMTVQARVQG